MAEEKPRSITFSTPGFTALLALVFITLKLTGYIDWSWLWVLSPLWIPIALVVAGLLLACAIGGTCLIGLGCFLIGEAARDAYLDRKRRNDWDLLVDGDANDVLERLKTARNVKK